MPDTALPAPKNNLLSAFKIVLEMLIEGAGVDVVVAAAIAEEPFLSSPFIYQIFTFFVDKIAAYIDVNLFKFGAQIIIRIQNDNRRNEFNESMIPIMNGAPNAEEIQRAKDAIDKLVNRGR